jgi:Effector Associated Constant Component 1
VSFEEGKDPMSDDVPSNGALQITADDPADLEELRRLLGSLPGTSARYRAAEPVPGTLGGAELLEVVAGAVGGAPISAVLVAWIRSKTTRIQLELHGMKLKLTSDDLEKELPQVESLIAALNRAAGETHPHAVPGPAAEPGPAPIPAPSPIPAASATPDAIDG